MDERYRFAEVDVGRAPRSMDLPGVEGLPTFVFLDRAGGHVLTRSGFRPPGDLAYLLEVVAERLREGKMDPYPTPVGRAPPAR